MLTEAGVRRLVSRICEELDPGTPAPVVKFGYRKGRDWEAQYDPSTKEIVLPNRKWIKEYKVTTAMGYRLLVLHEVGHHLFGASHDKQFYYGLFGLCELFGVPLSFAFLDEANYKIRGAKAGMDFYIKSLRDRIDELSIVRRGSEPRTGEC